MKNILEFKTEFWIPTYTKICANTIYDFKKALKIIPQNSLLYHFYINIFNYHSIPSIYTNSFSYWFYKNGYSQIGEEISLIDPTDYFDIEKLRQDLIDIISKYEDTKTIPEPFHFLSIERNIFYTNLKATNLEELIDSIKKSSINSVFYHLITSKVDNKKIINDYSEFLNLIGQHSKAELINKIDIYALNLYKIKELILEVLTK